MLWVRREKADWCCCNFFRTRKPETSSSFTSGGDITSMGPTVPLCRNDTNFSAHQVSDAWMYTSSCSYKHEITASSYPPLPWRSAGEWFVAVPAVGMLPLDLSGTIRALPRHHGENLELALHCGGSQYHLGGDSTKTNIPLRGNVPLSALGTYGFFPFSGSSGVTPKSQFSATTSVSVESRPKRGCSTWQRRGG